jgi:hypothetical protein
MCAQNCSKGVQFRPPHLQFGRACENWDFLTSEVELEAHSLPCRYAVN